MVSYATQQGKTGNQNEGVIMADDKQVLQWGTAADAAAILDVSVGTVDRWVREGRVQFRRLGQRLHLDDVRRLAEVGEVQYMTERSEVAT